MILGGTRLKENTLTQFLTKARFSTMIEEHVQKLNCGYMEAIIDLCEKHNIEVEDVKKYVSSTIKTKIECEAKKLNFLGGITTTEIELGE